MLLESSKNVKKVYINHQKTSKWTSQTRETACHKEHRALDLAMEVTPPETEGPSTGLLKCQNKDVRTRVLRKACSKQVPPH